MSDISPFTATRDDELGSAVRAALEPMHHEAFVARVRARIGQSGRAWEDELAGWFWQGLVAASLATGAMILGTTLDELERTGGRYGLVTLCIGAGMGVATIIERV